MASTTSSRACPAPRAKPARSNDKCIGRSEQTTECLKMETKCVSAQYLVSTRGSSFLMDIHWILVIRILAPLYFIANQPTLPKRRPGELKWFASLSLSPFLNVLETRAANLRLVRRGSHWRERLCA